MENNKKTNVNAPYDDVHRTLLNDCPKLIIPVVNEMFQKKHSDNEKITLLNNELFINRQNGRQVERITDTNLLIGSVHYHLECQSTADGTLMYRIFEYDSQIALQSSELSQDKLTVKFPNTAVLYLRHNKNTPDEMTIEIRVPGATCSYRVPVMKVQNYSVEVIFEKKLLFLIPFHIFAYEQGFPEYEANEQKMRELTQEYALIVERLNEYAKTGVIDEYTKSTIIDMSKKVLEHLAKKYSNVKEEVGAIMGGKILDYPAKDIFNQGRAQAVLDLLSELGAVPETIAKTIIEEKDVNLLKLWLSLAAKSETMDDFVAGMKVDYFSQ